MLLNPTQIHIPETVEEACKLLSELEDFKIQAGGTFLVNSLKHSKQAGRKTPAHIVSLHKLDHLRGIELTDTEMTIQAMTTVAELYDSEHLIDNFQIFRTVCKDISTQPIRNMATVGGNLTCRYTWTEMPAVMTGLGATLHFMDTDGKAIAMPAEDFFKEQAKTKNLLTHITIPRDNNLTIAYRRVRKTISIDIPLLSVIIATKVDNNTFNETRVAVNNCVEFAKRDTKLEDFLNGKKCEEALAEEALKNLTEEIYDTRSTEYKSHMARVSIKNALLEIING